MDLDWLIIGGGIHGVHLAVRLLGEAQCPADELRILDPEPHLLARWRRFSATTGMTHLRSTVVHHLDLDPYSLLQYAEERADLATTMPLFVPPYDRPSLALFDAHCDRVIERYGLADLHVQDHAVRCVPDADGVTVTLASGATVRSRHVILALGASNQPAWPEWASPSDPYVHHIFDPTFDGWPQATESVVVVGGGISAAQAALRLAEEGHEVRMLTPHALREHDFDSDPGWMGPKFMAGFSRERDFTKRRRLITEARHKGSLAPDVHTALTRAIDQGDVAVRVDEVVGLRRVAGRCALRLGSGEDLAADRVLLATGFTAARPGGAMIEGLVRTEGLRCAACGYPVIDEALRWHPRVRVTGPLAELELGPAARNITGARRAGDRVLASLEPTGTHRATHRRPRRGPTR